MKIRRGVTKGSRKNKKIYKKRNENLSDCKRNKKKKKESKQKRKKKELDLERK